MASEIILLGTMTEKKFYIAYNMIIFTLYNSRNKGSYSREIYGKLFAS